MKRIPCALFLATFFLLSSPSFSQSPTTPQHAPDGGTREFFDSILIPSMPNAPFTATVNAEWIRHLPDGSNITLKNHRTVARDAAGRVYQERALFVPTDGKRESTVTQIEISDPGAHQRYICRPTNHVCSLEQFSARSFAPVSAATAPTAASGNARVENLGTQNIAGLETIGTRETHLVETGTIGNEAPILEKREFWYSPQLRVNLITKRQDPRFASEQNFEVSNIALGEPDAKLFELPSGYQVIDQRLRRPIEVSSPPSSSQE